MSDKIWYFFFSIFFVLYVAVGRADGVARPRGSTPELVSCHSRTSCDQEIEQALQARMRRAGVHERDLGRLFEQASRDVKAGIQNSKAYAVADWIFSFNMWDQGSARVFDILADAYYMKDQPEFGPGVLDKVQSGKIQVIQGHDPAVLRNPEFWKGMGQLGIGAISVWPGTKLVSSLYKGARLVIIGEKAAELAAKGTVRMAGRRALQDQLNNIGEAALGERVLGIKKLSVLQAVLNSAAKTQFWKLGKWGLLQVGIRQLGLTIPSYPGAINAQTLMVFAATQGCLILADSLGNPTTKVIKLTGNKAYDFVSLVADKVRHSRDNKEVTVLSSHELSILENPKTESPSSAMVPEVPRTEVEDILQSNFATCEECLNHRVTADVAQRMTLQDLKNRLQVTRDPETGLATIQVF